MSDPQFDYVEARILGVFLSWIINADASALTPEELDALTQWELSITNARVPAGHWDVVEGGRNEFARCDVTGLMGDCETVRYYFRVQP